MLHSSEMHCHHDSHVFATGEPADIQSDQSLTAQLRDAAPAIQLHADGGLTLLIQNDSPGKDKETNWLPSPAGPFSVITRLYWPEAEALDGTWTTPR